MSKEVKQCKKHPRYKAVYPPRGDCEDCRVQYAAKHGAVTPAEMAQWYTRRDDGG